MRSVVSGLVGLVALLGVWMAGVSGAEARLQVTVDRGSQTMTVQGDDGTRAVWRVSTGRRGYTTPSGVYSPKRLARMHYSRKYHGSPMPHSIFFRGGYAIHGTYETGRLGSAASHGCVRLSPGHAAALYGLVQQHAGRGGTRIVIR